MIKTKGVHHIGIAVNNLERAVKFYTEVLGMTIFKIGQDDMGRILPRAELRSGNDIVDLFERPKPIEYDAVETDGAMHHAFRVDPEEFETAHEKLKTLGVKIHTTPSVDRPRGRGFYFFDTEGNLLQLYAPPK
jgi:catechol 2,3-dioxygenase-like lactoylglutathione lyase family enzyme